MYGLHLDKIGITDFKKVFWNPSYDELFRHETDPALEVLERGVVTDSGAVAVDTGRFTGRSPKDKYIVVEENSKQNIWWAAPGGSDNQPLSEETWQELKKIAIRQLNGKSLYVMDGYSGAIAGERLSVQLVTEIAWVAHFFKNMFIRPTQNELKVFSPDWNILHACKATCADYKKLGLRSEVFIAFHLKERTTIIGGTWYGGEIKKGMFSVMNYLLPLKGIGSFHCSANVGEKGDTALFFGLSGTGKTTLSADPKRYLIGDDEHGWDDDGVFNLEGGCYAKCINLSKEKEPDIYSAIRRNALLENVDVDAQGHVDFASKKKTENTRVSYPIEHIKNIVRPVSRGGHPSRIIFLTCDAFGVLPPVSKLNRSQAMYHYLSGYTAKVAGTELGIVEPKAAFSACFGQPFLLLHPTRYADILGEKMERHNANVYLVNTGWIKGAYGVGERIDLKQTRAIIDAILDGSIEETIWKSMPVFGLSIPEWVDGVDANILDPRWAWKDKNAYDQSLLKLANMFIENFKKFMDTARGKELAFIAGPQLTQINPIQEEPEPLFHYLHAKE